MPTWTFFDYREDITNGWMLHFTDEAYSIKDNGFEGFKDMYRLGLTTGFNKTSHARKFGDYSYAFAFSADDRRTYNSHGERYGSEIVMFKATGIKCHHSTDEYDQVIFDTNTVRNMNVIENDYGTYYIESQIIDKRLFESDELSDVVNYIENRYNRKKKV